MKSMGVNEIRESFLAFFESKDHLRLPSASLVPHNDKSLLLINSGMAPLKPYFTGQEIPPRRRVTTCQKCIRTGDIENVGKTAEKGKSNFVGPEIEGKKLGVIGLGAIGVLVANAANKLGMEVYGYDPFMSVNSAWALSKHVRQAKDMDEIFKTCDYITVHVPSTKDTKGMLNKEKFALMKDGARLLNFARGDLVVNEDLLEAVESGKLSKYITDFASQELIGKDNIIVLPHLGASTPESEDNCAKMAVQELKDFLENGNIKNSVNFPAVNQPRESKVRLCITNKNMPNILARISKLFADHNLNIENMVNRSRGDYAYTLIDTNDDVRQDIIERIEAAEGIINVRVIK